MIKNNSALIVFLVDPSRTKLVSQRRQQNVDIYKPEHFLQSFGDAFLMATHAGIAANVLGYGIVYLGSARMVKVREMLVKELNLPEDVIPVLALAIGKFNETSKNHSRRLNRVYENSYNIDIVENEIDNYQKDELEFFGKQNLPFDYFNHLMNAYKYDLSDDYEEVFKKYFEQ